MRFLLQRAGTPGIPAVHDPCAEGDRYRGRRGRLTPDARPTQVEWPKALHEQMRAVTALVEAAAVSLNAAAIAKAFTGARKPKVKEILDALTDLGRLTQTADGHWQG